METGKRLEEADQDMDVLGMLAKRPSSVALGVFSAGREEADKGRDAVRLMDAVFVPVAFG